MTRGRAFAAARGDRGSATIWVLACVLLVLTVLMISLVRAAAVLARHRAESAADLAALAAAARIGTSGDPCAAAEASARHNAATLISCDVDLGPDGRSGTIRVRVSTSAGLPVVGTRVVSASARAGRLAPSGAAAAPGRPACGTRSWRPGAVYPRCGMLSHAQNRLVTSGPA